MEERVTIRRLIVLLIGIFLVTGATMAQGPRRTSARICLYLMEV
jgi:hypothetical protein